MRLLLPLCKANSFTISLTIGRRNTRNLCLYSRARSFRDTRTSLIRDVHAFFKGLVLAAEKPELCKPEKGLTGIASSYKKETEVPEEVKVEF